MSELTRLPGAVTYRWEWQLHAACRGLPSDVFFSPDRERGPRRARRVSTAKRICAGCPVRRECLTHAVRVREPYGVWGGLSERERERLVATG